MALCDANNKIILTIAQTNMFYVEQTMIYVVQTTRMFYAMPSHAMPRTACTAQWSLHGTVQWKGKH
jgi:hypothetical protein